MNQMQLEYAESVVEYEICDLSKVLRSHWKTEGMIDLIFSLAVEKRMHSVGRSLEK